MACYKPIEAWYSKVVNPTGKRSLVFNPNMAHEPDAPIEIACGQCIGCRLERSRQWAIRCIHEASLYEDNCFITLTFNPESLAARSNPWSVDVRDFQLFMKRLRKKYGGNIRFFHCGEYGDIRKRPHYHACLFNFDFPDKELWRVVNGNRLYISKSLSELWPYGFCTIGDVTFESAAYVARYIMKKVTGDGVDDIDADTGLRPYERVDDNGELIEVKPEYVTMSRRGGIGKGWYDKFKSDVYPHDYVIVNGRKMRPPKFYDRLYAESDPYDFDFVKDMRKIESLAHSENNTRERLDTREKVKKLQIERLVRNHDKD